MQSTGGTPFFSVVVPTYDRPDLLQAALASVQAQTEVDWECIVVDDASPHPPVLPSDPRFRLVRQPENRGVAAARNVGIREARGEAIAFLDDDDLWLPERLHMARIGLACSPIALCGEGDWTNEHMRPVRRLQGYVFHRVLDGMTPQLGRVAVTRHTCLAFDESYRTVEDLDWWLRMSRENHVTSIDRPGWKSRVHSGPRREMGLDARMRDSERLMLAHPDYFDSHPRARAFRLFRIGVMAAQSGDLRQARRAHWRSLRAFPSWRPALHFTLCIIRRSPGSHS